MEPRDADVLADAEVGPPDRDSRYPMPDGFRGGTNQFGVRRAFDGPIVSGTRSPYADNVWCASCGSTDCTCSLTNVNEDGSRDW